VVYPGFSLFLTRFTVGYTRVFSSFYTRFTVGYTRVLASLLHPFHCWFCTGRQALYHPFHCWFCTGRQTSHHPFHCWARYMPPILPPWVCTSLPPWVGHPRVHPAGQPPCVHTGEHELSRSDNTFNTEVEKERPLGGERGPFSPQE